MTKAPWKSKNLITRLRWRGFKFCGKGDQGNLASDVMFDAADRIEMLEAALRSIAANACCDSCREAALVARKALGKLK